MVRNVEIYPEGDEKAIRGLMQMWEKIKCILHSFSDCIIQKNCFVFTHKTVVCEQHRIEIKFTKQN